MEAALNSNTMVTQFTTKGGSLYRILVSTDEANDRACNIRVEPCEDSLCFDVVPSENGLSALSPREVEVLRLIEQGYTNEQIASELYISLSTVKSHIHNMFRKLDVSNRTMLMNRCQQRAS